MTPGRKPSIRTSARSTRSSTTSTPRGVLQVDRTDGRPRREDVLVRRRQLQGVAAGPVDADDVGAEVGQQHRGERAGADADELDDAHAARGPEVLGDGHASIVTVILSRSQVQPGHIPTVRACAIIGVTFRHSSRGPACTPNWPTPASGSGEPLVLIHGIGHRRQAWDPVLEPARRVLRRHRGRPRRLRRVSGATRTAWLLDGQRLPEPRRQLRRVGHRASRTSSATRWAARIALELGARGPRPVGHGAQPGWFLPRIRTGWSLCCSLITLKITSYLPPGRRGACARSSHGAPRPRPQPVRARRPADAPSSSSATPPPCATAPGFFPVAARRHDATPSEPVARPDDGRVGHPRQDPALRPVRPRRGTAAARPPRRPARLRTRSDDRRPQPDRAGHRADDTARRRAPRASRGRGPRGRPRRGWGCRSCRSPRTGGCGPFPRTGAAGRRCRRPAPRSRARRRTSTSRSVSGLAPSSSDSVGQGRVDDPQAGVHPPHRVGQLGGRGVLDHEPAHRLERAPQVARATERGDHEDAGGRREHQARQASMPSRPGISMSSRQTSGACRRTAAAPRRPAPPGPRPRGRARGRATQPAPRVPAPGRRRAAVGPPRSPRHLHLSAAARRRLRPQLGRQRPSTRSRRPRRPLPSAVASTPRPSSLTPSPDGISVDATARAPLWRTMLVTASRSAQAATVRRRGSRSAGRPDTRCRSRPPRSACRRRISTSSRPPADRRRSPGPPRAPDG